MQAAIAVSRGAPPRRNRGTPRPRLVYSHVKFDDGALPLPPAPVPRRIGVHVHDRGPGRPSLSTEPRATRPAHSVRHAIAPDTEPPARGGPRGGDRTRAALPPER